MIRERARETLRIADATREAQHADKDGFTKWRALHEADAEL